MQIDWIPRDVRQLQEDILSDCQKDGCEEIELQQKIIYTPLIIKSTLDWDGDKQFDLFCILI